MKTPKSYHIIHKAERQLLYERKKKINHSLHMYEMKRLECYSQLRNLIQDRDISQCSLLINNIKEFRHNRTKSRQKDKFSRLSNNIKGYMYYNDGFSTFGKYSFWATQGFQQTLQ